MSILGLKKGYLLTGFTSDPVTYKAVSTVYVPLANNRSFS